MVKKIPIAQDLNISPFAFKSREYSKSIMWRRNKDFCYKRIIMAFLLLAALVILLMVFFLLPENSPNTNKGGNSFVIKNQPEKMESLIYALLTHLKANELHNPPFSSDYPKIEIYVGDSIYNARVIKKKIILGKGAVKEKDIIVYTTEREITKMAADKNYVKDSFTEGLSKVELIASKSKLFLKGYLKIYEEFS